MSPDIGTVAFSTAVTVFVVAHLALVHRDRRFAPHVLREDGDRSDQYNQQISHSCALIQIKYTFRIILGLLVGFRIVHSAAEKFQLLQLQRLHC